MPDILKSVSRNASSDIQEHYLLREGKCFLISVDYIYASATYENCVFSGIEAGAEPVIDDYIKNEVDFNVVDALVKAQARTNAWLDDNGYTL